MDDRAAVGYLPSRATSILGGPDSDLLEGDVAPAFPDDVSGYHLDGGAGDDQLLGTGGNDFLVGGGGADVLRGRGGRDTVDYRTRSQPVEVTVDGVPNDGAEGEGDNVQTEDVYGGSGPDRITGNAAANILLGGRGADVLSGGGGADELVTTAVDEDTRRPVPDPGDVVRCGDGDDHSHGERTDRIRTDCELVGHGIQPYRAVIVTRLRVRASRNGHVRLGLRRVPPPTTVSGLDGDALGRVTLTTPGGKTGSSSATFRLGEGQATSVRLRLRARARRLLARSKTNTIRLSAVRELRPEKPNPAAPNGSLRISVSVTVVRSRAARAAPG